jgi:hypothetical protein
MHVGDFLDKGLFLILRDWCLLLSSGCLDSHKLLEESGDYICEGLLEEFRNVSLAFDDLRQLSLLMLGSHLFRLEFCLSLCHFLLYL